MAEAALAQTSGQLAPIGLSMGGYVALEMARLAPARISAMALFSTNCRQDDDAQRAYREQAIRLAQQDQFRGVTRQFLGKFLSPRALADTTLVDGVLAMAADIGRITFARQQHAILGRRAQHDTLASLLPLSIVRISDTLTPPVLFRKWLIWQRMPIFVCCLMWVICRHLKPLPLAVMPLSIYWLGCKP